MSDAWRALAHFEHLGLRAALQQVEATHAPSADSSEPPPPDVLASLRAHLAATPLEQIAQLAGRLRRSELSAVADLLAGQEEEEIVEKAVRLGLLAKLSTLRRRSWRVTVESGPSRGLQALLRGFATEGTLGRALDLSGEDLARIESWLSAPSIPEGMLADRCTRADRDCAQWRSRLPQTQAPIGTHSALWKCFREQFLTRAPAHLLISEGATFLLHMAKESSAATQEGFARHYLIALRSARAWDEGVFRWITNRFGELDYRNPVDFWRRAEQMSPGILRDLSAWRALRTLEAFFGSIHDPHGRFAFWKTHFGEQIIAADTVAQGQAAYLHLPPLVIVEFAHVGNAAYVYDDAHLPWVETRRSGSESAYKDRKRLARNPRSGAEARIIHVPGWERTAAAMLSRLINKGRTR